MVRGVLYGDAGNLHRGKPRALECTILIELAYRLPCSDSYLATDMKR
jgi:hypothetical protein